MQTYTDDNTLDKITSWASDKYTAAAPSLTAAAAAPAGASPTPAAPSGNSGLLAAAATTPATSSSSAPKQGSNVSDWYKTALGRDGDAAGVSYWQNALATSGDPGSVYGEFLKAAEANHEGIKTGNPPSAPGSPAPGAGPAAIDPSKLAVRNVDAKNETVNGQLQSIMAADSPLLQQARADGQRTAFDRGLGNSSIAASAGEDSLLRAALQIAQPDAAAYGKAGDYNVAAKNQAVMFNAEAQNQFGLADKNIQAQQIQQSTQLAQQMTLAQMQDQTTRWQQEQQNANSRYNTDQQYKQQVDNQKLGVANNIIANMDLSPDRKAAMLEQLGFGTSATPGKPGTGLAGAVYVIDSTGSDLQFGGAYH